MAIDPVYRYTPQHFKDITTTFDIPQYRFNGYKFNLDSYYTDIFGPVYFINRSLSLTLFFNDLNDMMQFVYTPGSPTHLTKHIWRYKEYLLGRGSPVPTTYPDNPMTPKTPADSKYSVTIDFSLSRSLLPVFDVSIAVGQDTSATDILSQLISKLSQELQANTFLHEIRFDHNLFKDIIVEPFEKSFRGDILSIMLNVINLLTTRYKPIDLPIITYIANSLDSKPTIFVKTLTYKIIEDTSIPILLNAFIDKEYHEYAPTPTLEKSDDMLMHIQELINRHARQITSIVFNIDLLNPKTGGIVKSNVMNVDGSTVSATTKSTDSVDNTYNTKLDDFIIKSNSALLRNSKILDLSRQIFTVVANDPTDLLLAFDLTPFVFRYTETEITKNSPSKTRFLKLNWLCIPYQVSIQTSLISDFTADNKTYNLMVYTNSEDSHAIIVNLLDKTWSIYDSLTQLDQKEQTVTKSRFIAEQIQNLIALNSGLNMDDDLLFKNLHLLVNDKIRITMPSSVNEKQYIVFDYKDISGQLIDALSLGDQILNIMRAISSIDPNHLINTLDILQYKLLDIMNTLYYLPSSHAIAMNSYLEQLLRQLFFMKSNIDSIIGLSSVRQILQSKIDSIISMIMNQYV